MSEDFIFVNTVPKKYPPAKRLFTPFLLLTVALQLHSS